MGLNWRVPADVESLICCNCFFSTKKSRYRVRSWAQNSSAYLSFLRHIRKMAADVIQEQSRGAHHSRRRCQSGLLVPAAASAPEERLSTAWALVPWKANALTPAAAEYSALPVPGCMPGPCWRGMKRGRSPSCSCVCRILLTCGFTCSQASISSYCLPNKTPHGEDSFTGRKSTLCMCYTEISSVLGAGERCF